MKKISELMLGVYLSFIMPACFAADRFDILPDLPEPLASAAQASSVTTTDAANTLTTQSVGQEPNFLSMIFSLIFVILLIYATGILYTKLNKFGIKTLKKQIGDNSSSQVSVISTTSLGSNKTLHVVELDGKRMLIGASANSIDLIKDLGSFPSIDDVEEGEFSKIEIPNIRIPKIEIPRIEIPGFTKVVSKRKKIEVEDISNETENEKESIKDDTFEFSDIYEEENPDGIIDKLFHTEPDNNVELKESNKNENVHRVDPDEFALYQKYL